MIFALLTATTALTAATSARSQESRPFAQAPVADEALADMRGGFALPGGMAISVAVQSDTRVNGTLLLRSVFVMDQGAPELRVFAQADGVTTTTTGTDGRAVTTGLTVSNGHSVIGGAVEGLRQIDVVKDGAAVGASGGTVRVESLGAGSQVVLTRPTLDVSHLAGQAYGSIAANRGNDVTIDTATDINIELSGTDGFELSSSMMRVEALVFDAATRIGR